MAIETQMIEFRGNGDMVPGYLARPTDRETSLGVVVIQEWWGLDDHIKGIADRFAEIGITALAPDLYRGVVTTEPDEARKLAMALERDRAMKDMQGAVDYLVAQPYIAPKQIGMIGFCMGGRLTGWMALYGRNVGAAVPFYGIDANTYKEMEGKVTCPMLCIYGETDAGFPVEMIRANESTLKAANRHSEQIIYPEAPHAFFNDTRPAYRKEASEDAWKRALVWFRDYLKNEVEL